MKADKDIYKPREVAKVSFSVKDAEGKPAPAALGISIVDEAVFAVSDFRPGLEQTYFEIEKSVMNPSYVVYGISNQDIMTGSDDEEENKDIETRAQAYFATAKSDDSSMISKDSYSEAEASFIAKANEKLSAKITAIVSKYKIDESNSGCDQNEDLITATKLSELFLLKENFDFWGNIINATLSKNYGEAFILAQSFGPDEIKDTKDDIVVNYQICKMNWDDANAGGADSVAPTADENPSEDGGDKSGVKVRSWFPETLYFNPELITDNAGNAEIDLTVADSITLWRVTAMANTASGNLGSMLGGITVFQDFFVDIDFPVTLRQNDEVSVPIGIYNYLAEAQTIKISVETAAWFESAVTELSVEVPANSVTSAYLPIKVVKVGTQSLTVYAEGSKMSDAVKRSVKIIPDGIQQESTKSDLLTKNVSLKLTIPEDAIPDSEELFVKIYPGIMSQAIEGLDSMLQMPTGCFEQTSSSTYPNVLVLQYLAKTNQLTPEIEIKAKDFISQGYQRLLTYEVSGGGFEWFGNTPANFVLTCFGMMEFIDMSKVHPIDETLVPRTAAWMASRQNSDGSFEPDSGGIAEGAINNFQTSLIRTTAYAVWALSRGEVEKEAATQGAEYLLDNLSSDELSDNYTKAITAIALVSSGYGSSSAVSKFIDEIIADKKEDGLGGYYWEQTEKTETYSDGNNAAIETTALIGLLLLENDSNSDVLNGIISWMSRQKDSFGNWSTTQGTVLALRLLIGSLDMTGETDTNATIKVSANGGEKFDLTVTPKNSDILSYFDLKSFLKQGENTVDIEFSGNGTMMYSAIAKWYVPGSSAPAQAGPLTIAVSYDKATLEVNDTVAVNAKIRNISDATVSIILASIGTPPGFDLVAEKLDTLVAAKTFLQRYERTPRQLILYIAEIKAGEEVEINYDLIAKYPLEASTGEASVNPYYNPEQVGFEASKTIKVE